MLPMRKEIEGPLGIWPFPILNTVIQVSNAQAQGKEIEQAKVIRDSNGEVQEVVVIKDSTGQDTND